MVPRLAAVPRQRWPWAAVVLATHRERALNEPAFSIWEFHCRFTARRVSLPVTLSDPLAAQRRLTWCVPSSVRWTMPDSNHPKPAERPPAEPTLTLRECPNCGRKSAVVFTVSKDPKDTHHLVCTNCCPKPAGTG